MRIKTIYVQDVPPVQNFCAEELTDLVVIAGPNGVGKTRLIDAFINAFQNQFHSVNTHFVIEATTSDERSLWPTSELQTRISSDARALISTLEQNKRRRNFRSSILHYESNRSLTKIKPLQFQFDMEDPWEESVPWYFGGLSSRWQDTQHAIFRKIHSQRTSIANRAIQLRTAGHTSMKLEFPDPMDPFRDAFDRLLGPKSFGKADLRSQTMTYMEDGRESDISSLSSGEKEVLNITFDFILRRPSHCIVFFDEPELHLHPELLSRMISTLRHVGESNQFFLITHSSELISSSLDETVLFLTPPRDESSEESSNQAIRIRPRSDVTEALHQLGQSVGVVSLGKRIVLIEGAEASLDKKTYARIVSGRFPGLVLVPSGDKTSLETFARLASDVLAKTLWGIQFFMLADRDFGSTSSTEERKNFRVLPRYHVENYFLDSEVLSQCFDDLEEPQSWLRSSAEIEAKLRELARKNLGYAVMLSVTEKIRRQTGNVDLMVSGSHELQLHELRAQVATKARSEGDRIQANLEEGGVIELLESTFRRFENLLSRAGDDWKNEIPGKPVLKRFCAAAGMDRARLTSLYLAKAEQAAENPFQEIVDIFRAFSEE